jgi:predicted deacylase
MRSEKRYVSPDHCVEYFDTGEKASLAVHELSANRNGPTLALLGGVHGDEPDGVIAIRRLFNELDCTAINGTVRAVPVANPIAFTHGTRITPTDGLNLARVFPGDADGSVTSRIAHIISSRVIAGSDVLIDLHSAGAGLEMPLFCGYRAVNDATTATSAEAARAFGCPLVWAHDEASTGRSLSVADDLNIPALYVESRGGNQVRHDELEAYVTGVQQVMSWMGMIDEHRPTPVQQDLIPGGHGNVDSGLVAPTDGLLVTLVSAGDRVSADTVLMHIFGHDGSLHSVLHAPHDGIVMLVRRTVHVRAGETICLLAPLPEPWLASDQMAGTG